MVGFLEGDIKSEANFILAPKDAADSIDKFFEPVGVVGEKSCETVLRFKILLCKSNDALAYCALMTSWFEFPKLEVNCWWDGWDKNFESLKMFLN